MFSTILSRSPSSVSGLCLSTTNLGGQQTVTNNLWLAVMIFLIIFLIFVVEFFLLLHSSNTSPLRKLISINHRKRFLFVCRIINKRKLSRRTKTHPSSDWRMIRVHNCFDKRETVLINKFHPANPHVSMCQHQSFTSFSSRRCSKSNHQSKGWYSVLNLAIKFTYSATQMLSLEAAYQSRLLSRIDKQNDQYTAISSKKL